jgi:phosphotriesterase-related protein
MIRTVLGDINPSELGVCYAHEHIIIDDNVATMRFPDFRLPSVENGITELKNFHAAGGRAMVDSMPCDAGRNVVKLAEISRATGVHILCPTGIHLAKYYDDGHWSHRYTVDQLAGLFIADIEQGIDRHDYSGPIVERTSHRAGLIKIATGGEEITARGRRVFEAAAITHQKTGAPILTHVEEGRGAMEQVELLSSFGVDLSKVVLSHTDRKPDPVYHRGFLQSGVCVEYDSAFRWKTKENPTLDLLTALIHEFPNQLMLGMDAARPSYWTSYGGSPGLCFLLEDFTKAMAERGIGRETWERIFITNPAATYQFKQRS